MDVLKTLEVDRVVAVVRAPRVADPVGLAETLAESGIRCVEFTFTIPEVLKAIEAAAGSSAIVGAGTVLDRDQARQALSAGARFLVSPGLMPELVEEAGDVPVFLGGLTPTELHRAVRAGAAAVKLFPARIGGPAYVADLLGPFPELALIPSGGIGEHNAAEFLRAGARAVYAGSGLLPPDVVTSGDLEEVARRASAFIRALD